MAKKVERQLSIYINGKEVNRSLKSIGGEIARLRNKQKKLTAGTDEWVDATKELKKAKNAYREVNDEIREVEQSLDDANESGQGFIGNLLGIFESLKSGDFDGAQAGLDGVKNGIMGATRAGLAFIATPIGAAIAALAGIALAGKEWFDYNKQVMEVNDNISSFTGLSGEALDQTRIKVTSLAETFDKEYLELLEAAAPIAKEFNISMVEALDVVGNGLAEGGRANEEYLSSLKEYPAFFAQAGFSVEEFKNLVNAGFDLKIYQDKLPDAIKEATIALTEQTPAIKDALTNAFSAPFADDILARVANGKVTVKDALIEIKTEADKGNVSIQANAQLTADLFKSAGEDAGSATKIWEGLTIATNEAGKELSELDSYYMQLKEANEELAEAQDNALKSDSFTAFSQQGELAWIKLKTFFFDSLDFAFQKFIDVSRFSNKVFGQFLAVLVSGKQRAYDLKNAFVNTFKNIVDTGGAAGKVIKSLFSFDGDQISKSIDGFNDAYKNLKEDVKEDATDLATGIKDVWNESGKAMDEYYAKQDAAAAQSILDQEKSIKDAAQKKIDDKLNAEQEAARYKAIEAYKKQEEDLADFIKGKRRELELDKLNGLQKELAQIDDKYAKEIEKAATHGDRLKEIELLKEQEKQAAKDALALQYAEQTIALDAEIARMKEEAELVRLAEKAAQGEVDMLLVAEKAREIAYSEIQRDLEKELAKVENVENAEALKEAIRRKYDEKKRGADDDYYDAKKKKLEDEAALEKQIEETKISVTLGALSAAAGLINEGTAAWKAVKIAEAVITTTVAAQNAYASTAAIPIVGAALAPIAAASAIAVGVANVKRITNTKIAKVPKPNKFYGGYTESTPIFDDEHGGATGYYHANEWVSPAWMTQSPRYANTISWLENERRSGPSYTTSSTATNNSTPETSNSDMVTVMTKLTQVLENPIMAQMYYGYEDEIKRQQIQDDIARSNNNSRA